MDLHALLSKTLSATYTIDRELGGGGMARVFVAEEHRLGRKVVIKTIAPELLGELSASRFEREMMLAASLQHPHIVPVLGAGVIDGDVPYYTMPYVEGSTLRARLETEPVPVADTVRILSHLATAMGYAHGRGVIHRDIKPENILLSDGIAVVTDFGVAKALSAGQASGAMLTAAGMAIGTPAYMAPEQATGDPASDERVDIYAFGVVAYEMLGGRRPFDDASAHQLIAAHLTQAPTPITSLCRDTPAALAQLVMQCLEKDPSSRPRSAAELLAVLQATSPGTTTTGRARGLRPVILGAALATAASIAILATRTKLDAPAPPETPATPTAAPAIAVMPFENLARDSAAEFIADGMTDDVLTTLDRVPTLRVASRATTFSYKGKREEPRALAQALGVDALLTGTVRRDGDVIMLSTQLVSGKTGLPLWSQSYQRPVQDLFEIQGDIARSIASALRLTLAPGVVSTARPTKDPVAYELYLKGRQLWRNAPLGDSAATEAASDMFKRAITRDPDFALAHAFLARTYVRLADHIAPRILIPKAKAAATRAVQLDPTLIDAGLSLASIRLTFDWDWVGAENEYRRALALDSTSIPAHLGYMQYLSAARRFDEALIEGDILNRLEWAQVVDTSNLTASQARRSALVLLQLGRHAQAESLYRVALARDTGYVLRWQYAMALLRMNRPAEAVALMEKVRKARGEQLPYLSHLGVAYAHAGMPDTTRRIIRKLERGGPGNYVPKDQLAALYLSLGDTAAALRYLRQAVEERHYWLPYLNSLPMFDPLRGNPEYRRLMRSIGAPDR